MPNIFTRSNNATPAPSRNTFDGSFTNNLTLKAGYLTPCFCKEVLPGDSFKIDATFGFNFQPMVFPVQTNMTARLHFFYVRNRPLWKGWQDFITKTDNPEGDSIPPYIHLIADNRDMVNTGEIGDYLGVPSVYYNYGNEAVVFSMSARGLFQKGDYPEENYINLYSVPSSGAVMSIFSADNITTIRTNQKTIVDGIRSGSFSRSLPFTPSVDSVNFVSGFLPTGSSSFVFGNTGWLSNFVYASGYGDSTNILDGKYGITMFIYDVTAKSVVYSLVYYLTNLTDKVTKGAFYESVFDNVVLSGKFADNSGNINTDFTLTNLDPTHVYQLVAFGSVVHDAGTAITEAPEGFSEPMFKWGRAIIDARFGMENSARSFDELPFSSIGNPDGIRISALPFRAYEAIYNSFYRDDRNNPRIVNGKPVYNDWLTTDAGGADMTHYHLFKSNWEQDVFTTAVQSPQQGVAPLVGVTATGLMTFKDDEGKTYTLQATIGEDGETITGISSYSSDMPTGVLRAMVDTISSGISINDFRNVNSLQRWLETNMRKGLRYKDQIEAHFGVSPTYSELDMPEFIGGMTRQVNVNRVTNVGQDTPENPLGTLAGNASVIGDAGAPISHYCDEHGWIIGIVSIVPTPVYSQQLNKQLLKTQLLDYYFPEFAHIGYQPILNCEIAPLQAFNSGQNTLDNVFGYQRAWYEYLANIDEVHGDFRQSMKDYIIQRIFAAVPQLGEQFLTVGDTEVNQVFAVRDDETDSDKIFGQIYFNVMMKRPIPKIGIPRLEV